MKIKLEDFNEIVDFIKENDGEFTKEELWEKFIQKSGGKDGMQNIIG